MIRQSLGTLSNFKNVSWAHSVQLGGNSSITTSALHPITLKLSLSDRQSLISDSDILLTTICCCRISSPAIAQMAFIVVFYNNNKIKKISLSWLRINIVCWGCVKTWSHKMDKSYHFDQKVKHDKIFISWSKLKYRKVYVFIAKLVLSYDHFQEQVNSKNELF